MNLYGLLSLFVLLSNCNVGCDCNEQRLLTAALTAVKASLDFFDAYKSRLILDSLIGVRIASDQFNEIIMKGDITMKFITETLQFLHLKAEKLIKDSISIVESKDPQYFKVSGVLLSHGLWSNWFTKWKNVNRSLVYKNRLNFNEIPVDENISDICLNQLVQKQCYISKNCWLLMTADNYSDYPLSHQLLYIVLGERIGCQSKLNEMIANNNQHSVSHLKDKFCANMLEETELIAANNFADKYQDLFMEDVTFCGLLGYKEFVSNPIWLSRVLEWQSSDGCYRSSRRKRKESLINNRNCLNHKTSTAISALVANIHFLLHNFREKFRE